MYLQSSGKIKNMYLFLFMMESSKMVTSPHCIVKIGYVKKNGQLRLGGGGGKHPFDIHAILRHSVSLFVMNLSRSPIH